MQIDIFADLVCPWCLIGKRRLERALADRPKQPVDIVWQPFQLNPGMPLEGMDRQAYLDAKFGGRERARQVYRMIEEAAEREGLALRFDRITRTPNTVLAHRLIRFAEAKGLANTMVERLFAAYLAEGVDIGQLGALVDQAVTIGFDCDEVSAFLDSERDLATIRSIDSMARRMGINAVPCFIIARRYAVSGAQDADVFLPLFDLAASEKVDVFAAQ